VKRLGDGYKQMEEAIVLVRSAIACTWLVAATQALLQTRKEIKRVEILAMKSYMPRCTI